MKKIHINAGHGGKDPGASGNGVVEKDITLAMAIKLGYRLKKQGFLISYTRIEDEYIMPTDIAKKANKEKADLFISLHCNAATTAMAKGIETLIFSNEGENKKVAAQVQTSLVTASKMTDRGLKERKDLIVLNSTNMTAILLELGFVSNKDDADKLKQEAFLDNCANAICSGVCAYYSISPKKEEQIPIKVSKIPVWQQEGLEALITAGIIGDAAYWESRMGNAITVGEVLGLLGKAEGLPQ